MGMRYEDRVEPMVAVLRRLGRPATATELYDELRSDKFRTPRRVAATFRYDQDPKRRSYPQPVFVRVGKDRIALRNPTDVAPIERPDTDHSRVYDRGQTVVPKRIRDAIGVEEGSTLVWRVEGGLARVFAIPKDPIAAARGILKGRGPTFEEFLADRNAERARELELEADQERRWRTYSTRPR